VGAPLVDRTGSWVGLVMAEGTVLPAQAADALLDEARRDLVAQVQIGGAPGAGGGGMPSWVLIVGGVGAAGAGAALLLGGGGGGGGGGGDGGGGGSGLGSITIPFPIIP
jgi:hypothetical protein